MHRSTDSPGRLEVVRSSPTILLDAAHNGAGAQVLVDAIEESFEFSRLVGVVGILEDKDAETILSLLEPLLAEIVVTQSSSVRSHDVDDLEELAIEICAGRRDRRGGRARRERGHHRGGDRHGRAGHRLGHPRR